MDGRISILVNKKNNGRTHNIKEKIDRIADEVAWKTQTYNKYIQPLQTTKT